MPGYQLQHLGFVYCSHSIQKAFLFSSLKDSRCHKQKKRQCRSLAPAACIKTSNHEQKESHTRQDDEHTPPHFFIELFCLNLLVLFAVEHHFITPFNLLSQAQYYGQTACRQASIVSKTKNGLPHFLFLLYSSDFVSSTASATTAVVSKSLVDPPPMRVCFILRRTSRTALSLT
jgi:hypothetical protein